MSIIDFDWYIFYVLICRVKLSGCLYKDGFLCIFCLFGYLCESGLCKKILVNLIRFIINFYWLKKFINWILDKWFNVFFNCLFILI